MDRWTESTPIYQKLKALADGVDTRADFSDAVGAMQDEMAILLSKEITPEKQVEIENRIRRGITMRGLIDEGDIVACYNVPGFKDRGFTGWADSKGGPPSSFLALAQCILAGDLTHRRLDSQATLMGKNSEYVFVPMSAVLEFEGRAGAFEVSARELRAEYQLIQKLMEIRDEKERSEGAYDVFLGAEGSGDSDGSDSMHVGEEWTAEDAALALVQRRIMRERPGTSWKDIAESLSVSRRTLNKHRSALFPSGHPYHPDTGTAPAHAR